MAQEKASDSSNFEYAYRTASNCARMLWGICHFAKLVGITGKEALPLGVTGLDRIRKTVADGKQISQEVKRALTEISGGTVKLASGPVDGTSAHDAALELGKHLLFVVGDGLSKDSKFYRPSFDSLSKKEKQALAVCFEAKRWKNREIRGLAKRIEREYLLACPDGPTPPTTEPPRDSAWVLVSTVWPGKFENYPQFKRFLDSTPAIRQRSPSTRRLEVHAGDWLEYWAEKDVEAFDALGEGSEELAEVLDEDLETFAEYLGNAAKRKAKLREKKSKK